MAVNPNDPTDSDASSDESKLLDEAKKRFELASNAENENRVLALEDLEFAAGNQWPERIKQARDEDGRPCLVINKVPQFIQQVTNDQRQNRPAIKVHPVDDQADVETAKIIQGLIRHIEYNSNAEVAYDTAFEFAAKMGWGFYRVITDYVSPVSFEQEILIKRIPNPFSVFFDPYSTEPDGSDASFAFITEDLSREEYEARYPNSKLAQKGEWEATGNAAPAWMPDGSARVAEYFYKETRSEKVLLLSDGRTVLESEMTDDMVDPMGQPISIVDERETKVPKICWVKLNACEILEKTDWPGSYIPIIPVYGSEINLNGKRILKGIVRDAKDPARMYNYWASAETEAIALAPRAPFIAAEGQLEGYEREWESANRRNHAVLTYKPVSIGGVPIGPPQRNAFEPAVQAITQARMLASDDLKATTGIYDASLGNKSNETSGVAIQRRNVQAQTSNFHFIDNLTRSLRHTGRILINLIPKVYDTARTARIVGEDGAQKVVRVNDPGFVDENGKPRLYALDAGQYDVTVDVGPSFQTKRQEAVASMLDFVKSYPMAAQFIGDLLAKNMDWPQATEIAERLKKTLPPQLQDDGKGQNQQLPPQVQAQMQQMGQMVEKLTQQLNTLQSEKEQKLIELESKERIEMAKIQAEIEITMAKLGSQESLQLLNHQIAEIEQRLQLLKMNAPIEEPESLSPAPMNGGMPAGPMGGQDPTGGAAPGSLMEGSNHVDPNAY